MLSIQPGAPRDRITLQVRTLQIPEACNLYLQDIEWLILCQIKNSEEMNNVAHAPQLTSWAEIQSHALMKVYTHGAFECAPKLVAS